MPVQRCPWCKTSDCVDRRAIANAENYGSDFFTLFCIKCKKPIKVFLHRTVVISSIDKGTHKEGDFGY